MCKILKILTLIFCFVFVFFAIFNLSDKLRTLEEERVTARPAEIKSHTFILLNSRHNIKTPVENHP